MFTPIARAFAQLDDPSFLGVLLRSAGWAVAGLLALAMLLIRLGAAAAAGHAWLGALLGGAGAAVLALYLFLPLAALIATLFVDRVAAAVEQRWYPTLPPPTPAPLTQQAWDGIALGLRVLGLQLLALLLALLLPGIGLVLGWAVAAWAIGRGLFMAVAMRRMDRPTATARYRQRRLAVIAQGALISAGSLVPVLNLLMPVLAIACMVHVLNDRSSSPGLWGRLRPC